MIVTSDWRVVVAVGEPISFRGRIFVCELDPDKDEETGCAICAFRKLQICKLMECRKAHRYDALYVHFKLLGEKVKGGEDDNQ